VDLVQLVPVDLHQDRVDLVQLEQEDLLELVLHVLLVLVLRVELLALVVRVEDQVLVAVAVAAVQLELLERAVLETHLKLESQREPNAKNSNYVQRLALVELLFHAVMATQLFVFVVELLFKTSQTRLMPMRVS
jgi:hypothetical protein